MAKGSTQNHWWKDIPLHQLGSGIEIVIDIHGFSSYDNCHHYHNRRLGTRSQNSDWKEIVEDFIYESNYKTQYMPILFYFVPKLWSLDQHCWLCHCPSLHSYSGPWLLFGLLGACQTTHEMNWWKLLKKKRYAQDNLTPIFTQHFRIDK